MITAVQQKKSFPWIYVHGSATSIFTVLTIFGPLFLLFCDSLDISKTRIGFIMSLLPFLYIISIFIYSQVMRHGAKKTLILFYFIRYWFVLGIPSAFWISRRFGNNAAFFWIVGCVLFFGICRAIAETGFYPLWQQLLPARSRGKVEAVNSIFSNLAAMIASLTAMLIIKKWEGIAGFSVAMYVGVAFGFIGVAAAARLPGGAPVEIEKKRSWSLFADSLTILRNAKFRIWLMGASFFLIGSAGMVFMPLFLRERIGFGADIIMLFSGCFQGGVLISAFLWGWSADRFGSKPVFMSALAGLCLVPICLFLLPRMEQKNIIVTCLLYHFFGIAFQGWMSGANRYFYTDVMPSTPNPGLCASMNLTVQQILAAFTAFFLGWMLDSFEHVGFKRHFVHVDNFSFVFLIMAISFFSAMFVMRKAYAPGGVHTRRFMSFFFEGNPLLAFSSIFRYRLANEESDRMEITRKLGDARSRLTVEELLQAIDDPNFNVRYEAIVSMARMPPDDKLVGALCKAVRNREPGLSEAAVWALGRMEAQRAVPILREMLDSEYALLRSQCARALGRLNDQTSVPKIIEKLKTETNDNICVSYTAALGRLKRHECLRDFMALLRRLADPALRGEVILAVSRLMGAERYFVNLWRLSRSDFETVCAEELMGTGRKFARDTMLSSMDRKMISGCARDFEHHDLEAGAAGICRIIESLIHLGIEPATRDVLKECGERLNSAPGEASDYILLALTAFHALVRK